LKFPASAQNMLVLKKGTIFLTFIQNQASACDIDLKVLKGLGGKDQPSCLKKKQIGTGKP
jgi:hypothetical protein